MDGLFELRHLLPGHLAGRLDPHPRLLGLRLPFLLRESFSKDTLQSDEVTLDLILAGIRTKISDHGSRKGDPELGSSYGHGIIRATDCSADPVT